MQSQRYLRRPEVVSKTGLSKTSIYNLEKTSDFPMHFMLTPRCAVWSESEIDAWLQRRRAAPARLASAPDQALRKTRPGKAKRPSARPVKAVAEAVAPSVSTCWVKQTEATA